MQISLIPAGTSKREKEDKSDLLVVRLNSARFAAL